MNLTIFLLKNSHPILILIPLQQPRISLHHHRYINQMVSTLKKDIKSKPKIAVSTAALASPEQASRMLARSVVTLLMEEPFYAHVLQNMTRAITNSIETAAVCYRNEQLMLLVNPDFFCSLSTDRQRVGLLKHEILHIALNHLFRPENNHGDSQILFNLAADIVVNQLIKKEDLPPHPVTIKSFPKLKLEENKNMGYYLSRLREYVQKNIGAVSKLTIIFTDSHSDHSSWKAGSETEQTATRIAIREILERSLSAARSHGQLPAELIQQLNLEKDQPAVVPWKQVLRQFVQRTGLTSLRYTRKRISRRYGTRPGLKIQQQLKLLVAIDTSGSVSSQNLKDFFHEITSLSRLLSEVWIVECDSKIHRCYRYQPGMAVTVKGRGGTDLNPVLEFVNTSSAQFDAVVYLTDGFAPQPDVIPAKPVLLVINNKDHSLTPTKNISIIEFNP